ncbi:AAA-like domain-containing protein [Lyngbya confervoides]|uniref:AAA-like domain-containing protein n=1 Tax=Lyngbya confervoides BDU141951 TaxID=1574623 RepID=A0ABD4T830_9CYAN|nr:AAA-like domain-containing protein [Lyngbya confervoides]MCM1984771.1 AAA-like domain-containing protein [Lyngbya confervoides BDU141951]
MKLQSWDLFLKHIADEYQLKGRLKETFLVRFAYENWRKPDKQVWDLAETASLETYKKQMTSIYACFANDKPQGCPDLDLQGKGPGKFTILKEWLKDQKYPEWWRQSQGPGSSPSLIPWQSPIPIESRLYIERPPIEADCYRELLAPGTLIRIKSPEKTGKTSLLKNILAYAQTHQHHAVYLNFQEAESAVFNHLDRFLRWFCANVSRALDIPPHLDEFWAEDLYGSLMSCKSYFQGAILQPLTQPLVLGLDNVDRIFEYPQIAADFLPMLRSWNEDANMLEIWQTLRLVLAHSTEVYVELDVNQSPFNIGWPVQLPGFTSAQVQRLGTVLGLDWSRIGTAVADQLVDLVGGHPYLVKLALEALATGRQDWPHLRAEAATQGGIYGAHLRELWDRLQGQPELAQILRELAIAEGSLTLAPSQTYRLESMGLVKLKGDEVTLSCALYRQYFQTQL